MLLASTTSMSEWQSTRQQKCGARELLQVLCDLFLALGVSEQQLLPLEVESLNCGGNARCSMELTRKLGLQPKHVLMIQVGGWVGGRVQAGSVTRLLLPAVW